LRFEPATSFRAGPVMWLAAVSSCILMAAPASAADWGPVKKQGFVGVGYVHDDEGALFVLCDTDTKLISILLNETRAKWTAGTAMNVITKADTGDEFTAAGKTLGPTLLAVGQEATFSLNTMGKAHASFVVANDVYARVFPATNFKTATEAVLAACGDHW